MGDFIINFKNVELCKKLGLGFSIILNIMIAAVEELAQQLQELKTLVDEMVHSED